MRMKLPIVALGALALTAAAPAMAHHAFGGEFDSTRPVLLKGVATALQYYAAPHLRTMGDIDLLVTADERSAAEAELERLRRLVDRLCGELEIPH